MKGSIGSGLHASLPGPPDPGCECPWKESGPRAEISPPSHAGLGSALPLGGHPDLVLGLVTVEGVEVVELGELGTVGV